MIIQIEIREEKIEDFAKCLVDVVCDSQNSCSDCPLDSVDIPINEYPYRDCCQWAYEHPQEILRIFKMQVIN